MSRPNITSLQSHILDEEARYPSASGDLTWIPSVLSLAAKTIASKVRHARIEDVLGLLAELLVPQAGFEQRAARRAVEVGPHQLERGPRPCST